MTMAVGDSALTEADRNVLEEQAAAKGRIDVMKRCIPPR